MSAALELQAALVSALRGAAGGGGTVAVYDGPPADATLPYIIFGDGLVFDWSTKTEAGREHRVTVTAWDEAGRIARLQGLVATIEGAMADLSAILPNNRIVSTVLVRSRVLRPTSGPWVGMVEYRVRTLAT